MKKILLLLVLCSSPALAGNWKDETVARTISEVREIEAAAVGLKLHSIQCADPRVTVVQSSLDLQASRLARVVAMAYSRSSGAGERYIGEKTLVEIRPLITDARFTLADALLAASCLDEADNIYRGTISTFTGASYDAFRQRAQIGVDDVRARRARP